VVLTKVPHLRKGRFRDDIVFKRHAPVIQNLLREIFIKAKFAAILLPCAIKKPLIVDYQWFISIAGGERGIRTLGTVTSTTV
jgi:hypothetical protein